MYIISNAITVRWVLAPTDSPLVASDYDIRVITSDLNGTYTDAGIINYIAPSETYGGSLEYTFTPITPGRWKVYLATGTGATYQIIDEKDFWVFLQSPVSAASLKAFGGSIPKTLPLAWETITVTEGIFTEIFGSIQYGMTTPNHNIGPFGSAVPAYVGGGIIEGLYYEDGAATDSFNFSLSGNHPQNLFTDLTPQDGTTLATASVSSHVFLFGYTSWVWNGLAIPARWDGSGISTVEFTP